MIIPKYQISINEQLSFHIQGHYFEDNKFQTPSAPPIAGDEEEVMFDAVGETTRTLCNRNAAQLCALLVLKEVAMLTFYLNFDAANRNG